MRFLRWTACVAAVFAAASVVADEPCGAVLCPSDLSVEDRLAVHTLVAESRVSEPEAFSRVAAVWRALPAADASTRGRLAAMSPALAAIGREALPALLERLVLADPGRGELTRSAWLAWRIGLIDAVGRLRDQRASAVLEALLARTELESEVRRAAAAALARLETDEAATVLVELSRLDGEAGLAVLAGMGHCRRVEVAKRLAEALGAAQSFEETHTVARSLATAASGPVWRAGLVRHPEEGDALRRIAATALIDAFMGGDEDRQRVLTTALLVVDEPGAMRRIAEEREHASGERAAALDVLAGRLAANPVSRMATPAGTGG